MVRKVILGDEFDAGLRARLLSILESGGAVPLGADWAVAGSQEFDRLTVSLSGATIVIEAETYAGLSLAGPDALVIEIIEKVRSGGN